MSDRNTGPAPGGRGPAGMGRGSGRGPGPMGGPPGPPPWMSVDAKAKNFKGAIRQLAAYLRPHAGPVVLVWIMALLSTVFTIIGPKIMGTITDELFNGFLRYIAGQGSIDFELIGRIISVLVVLYLLSAVASYIQGFIMAGVNQKISYTLRDDINRKIHRLPFRYFDGVTHGEILSRLTNDVDTVSQSLNQGMTQIITSVSSALGIAIMMLSISPLLTLAVIFFLPFFILSVRGIVKISQKHFKDQQKYLGHVNGHIEEMFSSHVAVKAFSGEADSVKTFDEFNGALYHSAWKSNFISGLMMPISQFLGNISYVAVCLAGGAMAVRGAMTVGGIQAFIQYAQSFNQPVNQIANISNMLQQTAAAAERVFEFLAEPEESPDDTRAAALPENPGSINFTHVAFGYSPDRIVIRDFSAAVQRGQKIAIVGPTGAGKTTIVKLLMRFYDTDRGSIVIDGRDIRSLRRNELRSLFGMVLQDTWLFNGTIADNIRYGRPGADDAAVEAAAKAAQVDHFVQTLPGGYRMVLNEESANISQGQKQLLTIARAILADPRILILDEATSSVDTRTEILIQKAMDNLMQGRTSFVIAHRLSTIRNADLILVMREGDIVEQGSHEALLAKNGFYADLYNSQFG